MNNIFVVIEYLSFNKESCNLRIDYLYNRVFIYEECVIVY